jgi:Uma2 family endonuclease
MITLRLQQIRVPPGHRILLEAISWPEFEAIVEELGEHRGTRIAYSKGTLEIVSPLPEHEKAKVVLSDLLKIPLDELNMPWESLGSTTFRRAEMAAGIEPDDCFYIQHQADMVGKDRIDLTVDPPPDLALEIDVTSITALQAYAALQVPEL